MQKKTSERPGPEEPMISADAIGDAIVAAFDEDNRTIAALRAKLEAADRHLAALNQHHDATQKALGLTGFESRSHASYIYDLQQQLADAHAKIRLLENKS